MQSTINFKLLHFTVCFQSVEMQQKSFATFDIIFHVNLMRELQRYARNLIFMMAFGGQTARYIKNCCCAYGLDCLCYLAGSSKAIVRIRFHAHFKFLQSLYQVDKKMLLNLAKTFCGISPVLQKHTVIQLKPANYICKKHFFLFPCQIHHH